MIVVVIGKPLLFLDVDGVLNPYACAAPPDGFVPHDLFPDEELVLVCGEHGAWITQLLDRFDVVWATAWNDAANTLLAPLLGIDPLPVALMPPVPFPPEAKVQVVDAYADGRPAVWIDDVHTGPGHGWAAGRAEPTLLVRCDPAIGLTASEIAHALAWVDGLADG